MPIQRIAFIGATGNLGRPVARELEIAGFLVSEISRRGPVAADLFDIESLRRVIPGHDAIYLNLSVPAGEPPTAPHAETDGLANVIQVAKESGIQRIGFLSSLVMNYQGMNGFQWWVFDVKRRAVEMLKASGIPVTIFYASSFMENLPSQRKGNKLQLAGKSKHPMWFIAGHDFGRQVATSFAMPGNDNREYVIQGLEPFTYEEASRQFIAHYPHEKLELSTTPLFVLRAMGVFSPVMRHVAKIIEALDNYPETFQAERTWTELGKPRITLAEFARATVRN